MSSIGGSHIPDTHSGIDHHGHHDFPGAGGPDDHDSGRLDEINAQRGVGDDRQQKQTSWVPVSVNQRGLLLPLPKSLTPARLSGLPLFAEAGAGVGRVGGRLSAKKDYKHHAKNCEKKSGISYWESTLQLARNQDGVQTRFRFLNACTPILKDTFFLVTFDLTRLEAFQDARMEGSRTLALIKDFFPSDVRRNLSQQLLQQRLQVFRDHAPFNFLDGQIWTPCTQRQGFTGFAEIAFNFLSSFAEIRASSRRSIESEFRSFNPPASFSRDFQVPLNAPPSQREGSLKLMINTLKHPHRSNAVGHYPRLEDGHLPELIEAPGSDPRPIDTPWWSGAEAWKSRLWAVGTFLWEHLNFFPPRAIFSWIFGHLNNLRKLFSWQDHLCDNVIQRSTQLSDSSQEYIIVFDQNLLFSLNLAPNLESFPFFNYGPTLVQALIRSSDKPWIKLQKSDSRSIGFRLQRQTDFEAIAIPHNYDKQFFKPSFSAYTEDEEEERLAARNRLSQGWEGIHLTFVHEVRTPSSAQLQTTQTIGAPQGTAMGRRRRNIELNFHIFSRQDIENARTSAGGEYERMHRLLAAPLQQLLKEDFASDSALGESFSLEELAKYASARGREIIDSQFRHSTEFHPSSVYAYLSGGKVSEAESVSSRAEVRTPLTTTWGGQSRFVDLFQQKRRIISLREVAGNKADIVHQTVIEDNIRRTPSAQRMDNAFSLFELTWRNQGHVDSNFCLSHMEYSLELVKPHAGKDALNGFIQRINSDFSLQDPVELARGADSRPRGFLPYDSQLFDDQRTVTLKGRLEASHLAIFRAFLADPTFSSLLSHFLVLSDELVSDLTLLREVLKCERSTGFAPFSRTGEEREVYEEFTKALTQMPQDRCRRILGLIFQVAHQSAAIQKYARENTAAPQNLRDAALVTHPPPEAAELEVNPPTTVEPEMALDRDGLTFLFNAPRFFNISEVSAPSKPRFNSWTKTFFDIIHEASRVSRTFDSRPLIRADDSIAALSDRWTTVCGQMERLRDIYPSIRNEIHMDGESRSALFYEWGVTHLELMRLLWPEDTIRQRPFIEPLDAFEQKTNRDIARTIREAEKIPEELSLLSLFVGGVDDLDSCASELSKQADQYAEHRMPQPFALRRMKKKSMDRLRSLERHADRLLDFLSLPNLNDRWLTYWPLPIGNAHTNDQWEVDENVVGHLFPLRLDQVGFQRVSTRVRRDMVRHNRGHELVGTYRKPPYNIGDENMFPLVASQEHFENKRGLLRRTKERLQSIQRRFTNHRHL